MEQAEYDALVTRMERFAREEPTAYARRVYMLAGLGYGFLLVVVVLLLCLAVLALASITRLRVIGIKIFFVVAALLWVVMRSLWVRLAAPDGTPLSREGSPELFSIIAPNKLQREFMVERLDQVWVTDITYIRTWQG